MIDFPDDTHRLSIIGRTGSGKTQAAVWHLSRRSFRKKPWVVFDYKGDHLLREIPWSDEIDPSGKVPKRPGLFVVRPDPDDEEARENLLSQIWAQENTGTYIDEGYMMGRNSRGFRRLLTQGRSKQCPLIVLSQRPVWMDRFVWSESEFFHVFAIQDVNDRKAVQGFIDFDLSTPLPKYHGLWYDISQARGTILGPVPDRDRILEEFETKTRKRINFM